MNRLAVIVSRGAFNNLVQVLTLLMAAVGSGMSARVFFRDEAVLKLTKAGVQQRDLSEGYRGREAAVWARLTTQGLSDLRRLLGEIREAGDVRFYACSSSMAICGVTAEDLIEGVDVRGLTAFLLEDADSADQILTF